MNSSGAETWAHITADLLRWESLGRILLGEQIHNNNNSQPSHLLYAGHCVKHFLRIHLFLTRTLWSKRYYCFHFTDEANELPEVMDLRIKPRLSLRAMSTCEFWAQKAAILGALAKVAVAGLFTEGIEPLQNPHVQTCGTAQATGMNWGPSNLAKKGLISVNYGINNAV